MEIIDGSGLTLQQPTDILTISDMSGRVLLRILSDGTWEIAPDDVPEAAHIFAETVANELLRIIPGRVRA